MCNEAKSITVTFKQWDKYNPRGDVKRPSWFRLEIGMVEDPDFFDFTHEEFRAVMYAMSQAAKKSGSARLYPDHAQAVCRISPLAMISAVEKLKDLGIVEAHVSDALRARYGDVTDTYATRRTNVRDEQDRTNGDAESPQSGASPAASEPELQLPERGGGAGEEVAPTAIVLEARTQPLVAAYCEAFKARYGTNPPIMGKDSGLLKNVVRSLGLPRSKELIRTYLAMNDAFFLKRRHDIATFALNLNAVAVKADTGQTVTHQDTVNAESREYYRSQLERIGSGQL